MARVLVTGTLFLAIGYEACVSTNPTISVEELNADESGRVYEAEVVRAHLLQKEALCVVELAAKHDGWWIQAFVSIPDVTSSVEGEGLRGHAFWNDHVFPYRDSGDVQGGNIRVTYSGGVVHIQGHLDVDLRDNSESKRPGGRIRIGFGLDASPVDPRESMLLTGRYWEYSSDLAEWRLMLEPLAETSSLDQ